MKIIEINNMTEEEFDRELKEAFPLNLLNNFEREHAVKGIITINNR